MDNMSAHSRPAKHPLLSRLGVAFLIIGLDIICLALVMFLGGGLLADYLDARHVTWRVPDPFVILLLSGIICPLIGFFLYGISGSVSNRRINVVRALTGIAFIPLLFVVFSQARPNYPTNQCLNNQCQLAMTFLMYAQDHGERLPQGWSNISGYVVEKSDLLVCPLEKKPFHRDLGYGFNRHIAGKSFADLPELSHLLLTADSVRPNMLISSVADIDSARHVAVRMIDTEAEPYNVEELTKPRGFIASFVDGHVEFIAAGKTVRLK
ncbi:MAG TPA: hypothetical protein VGL77_21280 [Armatimonadota bacterium]